MKNTITKEELDKLWNMYREFVVVVNVNSVYVPDFFAWIEKFKCHFDGIPKELRCACGKEWKHPGEHDEPIVS